MMQCGGDRGVVPATLDNIRKEARALRDEILQDFDPLQTAPTPSEEDPRTIEDLASRYMAFAHGRHSYASALLQAGESLEKIGHRPDHVGLATEQRFDSLFAKRGNGKKRK